MAISTPTPPWIAILESDATNDVWVADVDTIDWSKFTAGEDAIVLTKKSNILINAITGVQKQDLGAGYTYDKKFGRRWYEFTISGIVETWTEANNIDKFAMDDAHTTGTGFKRPYLVVCKALSDYKEFTDQNNARKDYLQCNLGGVRLQQGDSPLLWTYNIQGFSVWR